MFLISVVVVETAGFVGPLIFTSAHNYTSNTYFRQVFMSLN